MEYPNYCALLNPLNFNKDIAEYVAHFIEKYTSSEVPQVNGINLSSGSETLIGSVSKYCNVESAMIMDDRLADDAIPLFLNLMILVVKFTIIYNVFNIVYHILSVILSNLRRYSERIEKIVQFIVKPAVNELGVETNEWDQADRIWKLGIVLLRSLGRSIFCFLNFVYTKVIKITAISINKNLPSILITIGILGTFWGLASALKQIDHRLNSGQESSAPTDLQSFDDQWKELGSQKQNEIISFIVNQDMAIDDREISLNRYKEYYEELVILHNNISNVEDDSGNKDSSNGENITQEHFRNFNSKFKDEERRVYSEIHEFIKNQFVISVLMQNVLREMALAFNSSIFGIFLSIVVRPLRIVLEVGSNSSSDFSRFFEERRRNHYNQKAKEREPNGLWKQSDDLGLSTSNNRRRNRPDPPVVADPSPVGDSNAETTSQADPEKGRGGRGDESSETSVRETNDKKAGVLDGERNQKYFEEKNKNNSNENRELEDSAELNSKKKANNQLEKMKEEMKKRNSNKLSYSR